MTRNIISKAAPALLSFGLLAATNGFAQTATASGNAAANASATASSASAQSMTNVDATLRNSVDSKHAKAGDAVTAVTRSNSTLANGTKLPKGTQLMGHVTDATQYSKGAGSGAVSMVFDQARMKNGTTMPIHAVLRGITPPPSADFSGSGDADMMTPVGYAGGSGSGGGSVRPAGGSGGLLGGAGSAASGLTRTTASTAGNTLNGATNTVGNVASSTARTTGNAFGAVGSTVNGVSLSPSASGSGSGTLTSSGRDMHLQSGATLTFDVSAQ